MDEFPNFKLNPLTSMLQLDYEENEAVPPTLDKFSKEGILKNGQFLEKNT